MKAKKALTPAMEKALQDPRMRDPKIFSPDQYMLYTPSWGGRWGLEANRQPRLIGKGLYSHTTEQDDLNSRSAGRMHEDQVERLIDLHDQYED
jgi:hypothetical protein